MLACLPYRVRTNEPFHQFAGQSRLHGACVLAPAQLIPLPSRANTRRLAHVAPAGAMLHSPSLPSSRAFELLMSLGTVIFTMLLERNEQQEETTPTFRAASSRKLHAFNIGCGQCA